MCIGDKYSGSISFKTEMSSTVLQMFSTEKLNKYIE